VRGGGGTLRPDRSAPDRPLRTSLRLFAAALVGIAGLTLVRLLVDGADAVDALLVALLVVAAASAAWRERTVRELEARGRTEAESFARILRGLSRSVSPDAIVAAIVSELGDVAAADHVVVVQERPQGRGLEATLVSTRAGVPNATTLLPLSGLEDEPVAGAEARTVMTSVGSSGGAHTSVAIAAPPSAPAGTERTRSHAVEVTAERIAERVGRAYGLKHTLAAPLVAEGRVVGAIVLSRRVRSDWSPSARRILAAAATEASAALERAYSHREAATAASTDALTGLPNRRYFDEFCSLLARRRRAEDAVGVLMIDIDRFKSLNDRHGHAVGDEVLRAVGAAIGSTVREADVPARYGGEEFAVLLRNPSGSVALEVAERVRSAVQAIDLRELGVAAVSVSVGVAVAELPNEPIGELVERADRALYRAKRAGRDRVVAA
jgi:diguanylate cyclase (GGDEF)-like protein